MWSLLLPWWPLPSQTCSRARVPFGMPSVTDCYLRLKKLVLMFQGWERLPTTQMSQKDTPLEVK